MALQGDRLRVRFGWFFNQTFALDQIVAAEAMRWPWYYGLGWRSNFAGLIGLVASMRGVVVIRFRERQGGGGIVPFFKLGCDRLAVGLRQPQDLIDAPGRRGLGKRP